MNEVSGEENMGTLGFIHPANRDGLHSEEGAIQGGAHLCDGIKLGDVVPKIDLQACCGFFNGGLCSTILNGRNLLKDVAESFHQWPVAKEN